VYERESLYHTRRSFEVSGLKMIPGAILYPKSMLYKSFSF
jgi:hypothetical protein